MSFIDGFAIFFSPADPLGIAMRLHAAIHASPKRGEYCELLESLLSFFDFIIRETSLLGLKMKLGIETSRIIAILRRYHAAIFIDKPRDFIKFPLIHFYSPLEFPPYDGGER